MIDIERIRKATARIREMHSHGDVLAVVQEECGELITEIARLRRGRSHEVKVALEAIDCIVVSVSLLDMLNATALFDSVLSDLVEQKMQQIERYQKS